MGVAKIELAEGAGELGVRIVEVRPAPQARMTQSTIATGQIIYDSKVIDPPRIVCKCALTIDAEGKWSDTLEKIKDAYFKVKYDPAADLATIHSRTTIYRNCALVSFPHTENAESYDVFFFDLTFQQMQLVTSANTLDPADAADMETQHR